MIQPYPRVNLSSPCAQLDANGDEYGTLDPVSVTLDNATTSAYSLVNIVAADRKGLFYDLMRTLKDIHLRVAYAKVPQTLNNSHLLVLRSLSQWWAFLYSAMVGRTRSGWTYALRLSAGGCEE